MNVKKLSSLLPLLAALTVALFSAVPAESSSAGTTAVNFLKIGAGARGAGMGEAQAAIAEDVTAAYWNPAGLASMRTKELALMHYALVEEVRYQQASFGFPTKTYGHFALGASLFDYGSIQGYDTQSLPTASLDASHLLFSAAWGKQLFEKSKLQAGANLKYLQSELAGYKASAPLMDVGLLYPIETGRMRGLKLAATLRNMGQDLEYDNESSPLPEMMVLGSGFSALGGNLNIALDYIRPSDEDAHFAAGVEYKLFEMLLLRAGYNGTDEFVGNGITYGLGLKINQWMIDYALVPFGDLGNTNRVSVAYKFGRSQQLKSAEDQVEMAYRSAQSQLASGRGVEAYSTLNDLLLIAPWHKPSLELKAKIEKQFNEMAVDKNKAKMEAEIADKFTEAVAAFDRDELVKAKKGFDTILSLNSEHTGSRVYLEKIQNRYASLAQESFKLGMDFFAAGEYPKARMAFQKTLTIDENHVDARAMLTKTEEVMVDAAKREAEMARLAGATQAYKDGLAAYQKNNLEEALRKFGEVRALVPDFEEVVRYENLTKTSLANILFEESQVLFQNGQLEGAVSRLKRASELNPDDARIKSGLDLAVRDLGLKNAEESQKLYREGLESFLGGNTEKAEKNWKRALELDSTNEDALNALRKLEEQRNAEKK